MWYNLSFSLWLILSAERCGSCWSPGGCDCLWDHIQSRLQLNHRTASGTTAGTKISWSATGGLGRCVSHWFPGPTLDCGRERLKPCLRAASGSTADTEVSRPHTRRMDGCCWVPGWAGLKAGLEPGHRGALGSVVWSKAGGPIIGVWTLWLFLSSLAHGIGCRTMARQAWSSVSRVLRLPLVCRPRCIWWTCHQSAGLFFKEAFLSLGSPQFRSLLPGSQSTYKGTFLWLAAKSLCRETQDRDFLFFHLADITAV